MSNAPEKTEFKTGLTKINDAYYPLIERQMTDNNIHIDNYAKTCILNAISALNNALEAAGTSFNDQQLDQSNVTQILLTVASLKLNAAASPREVYFTVRNSKTQKYENGSKTDVWKKTIEMGIEGDGNDAILARFGRGIKEIRQHWLVRENDDFEYPAYNGLEMEPPKWRPKGTGKVVRVVYPIILESGAVEFYISERADVINNLIAHIKNNLSRQTFGIAKSTFDANPHQMDEINKKKEKLLNKAELQDVDAILQDPDLRPYISPAWKDPQSREAMIIRKMRNNIVKKIPKDFGHTLAEMQFEKASNEQSSNAVKEEIAEHANGEIIDIISDDSMDNTQNNSAETEQTKQQGAESMPPEATRIAAQEDFEEQMNKVSQMTENVREAAEIDSLERMERFAEEADTDDVPF